MAQLRAWPLRPKYFFMMADLVVSLLLLLPCSAEYRIAPVLVGTRSRRRKWMKMAG
jgi:hypothetical protein